MIDSKPVKLHHLNIEVQTNYGIKQLKRRSKLYYSHQILHLRAIGVTVTAQSFIHR